MHCANTEDTACACCGGEAFDVSPNPLIMALRFLAMAAGTATAAVSLIRQRKIRELLAWTGGWALFLTIPRYLICASCSGYGKMCYSYYLGKYTSMVFPRREKDVPMLGLGLEIVALSTIFWAPVLGMREDRRDLLRFLFFMNLVLAGQFFHACRYCGTHAEDDFKKFCPNYRFWRNFR